MEQETSNNLIAAFETAQTQLQEHEAKKKKFIRKIESRDRLVKELEGVISELTEQVARGEA